MNSKSGFSSNGVIGHDKAGERLQFFFIRESIAIASLFYHAPLFLTSDELDTLKRSNAILYSYYLKYPEDVEGFWLVESLGRYLGKELEKSRKIEDLHKELNITHIPMPIFITASHQKKIRNAILDLVSHYSEKQVSILLSSFDTLTKILKRMEQRVYYNLLQYFNENREKQEEKRNIALSEYRQILLYLKKLENREYMLNLSRQLKGTAAIKEIAKRLYPLRENDEVKFDNKAAQSFLSNYEYNEKSLIWGYERQEKTNTNIQANVHEKKVSSRLYAPVGFGEIRLDSEEDIVTTTLSDFYLHYVTTINNPDDESLENSKKIIPYLFFFKYHKQNKMRISQELDNCKSRERLLMIYSLTEREDEANKTRRMKSFIETAELNAKYIAGMVRTEFLERINQLFKNESFLQTEAKEQLLYIMATLRVLIREKKDQILIIRD
ncbi:MAG TPA: hypothetical protein ENN12_00810, partial [Epsilonproteobacteria bacterium]|nr:hypothetical protein [Campylobacterota bacterium]